MRKIFSGVLMLLWVSAVYGQEFPTKTIRIITAGVGGFTDTDSRLIAQGITGPLGQPVVVDNRTAIVSVETVAKAPPDGHTLLVAGGSLWILPLLQTTSYDPVKDFAPITLLTTAPNVLVVHPSLPVNSVKELIALAKAKPGEINYGSGASGGTAHLNMELFKYLAGVNIVRVAYKGGPASIIGLLGGEVQLSVADVGVVAPHVKAGKMRALAITSAAPSPLAPGLPTMAASGLPGYEAANMSGMWAPAKTPAPVINRLYQELARFFARPEMKERTLASGEEFVINTPEQFATTIQNEITKWDKVIKSANIRSD